MAYAHMYVQTRTQICVHLCFALQQNVTDLNATTHTQTHKHGEVGMNTKTDTNNKTSTDRKNTHFSTLSNNWQE